jgi:hypothetical protein
MNPQVQAKFIQYLQEELAIPRDSLAIALRHPPQNDIQLPMVLWQYGLVNLNQVEQILDWFGLQGI